MKFKCSNSLHLMKRRARGLSRRGFSLCEVVIAMGVFTFAATTILALVPSVLTSCRDSLERSVSAQIAAGIASDYAAKGFGAATNARLSFDDQGRRLPAGDANAVYVADVGVDKVKDENAPEGFSVNLRKVTVDVFSPRTQNLQRRPFCFFQANQGF